jgi:hypothetical protein
MNIIENTVRKKKIIRGYLYYFLLDFINNNLAFE